MLLFGALSGSGVERLVECRYCHKPANFEHIIRAMRYCEATMHEDFPDSTGSPMRIKLHNVVTSETHGVKVPLNATLRHLIEHLAKRYEKPVCHFVLLYYSLGGAGKGPLEYKLLTEVPLHYCADDLLWEEPVFVYYSCVAPTTE